MVSIAACHAVDRSSILLGTASICLGDGIGIRVGLRSQILRVRVSPGAPDKSTSSL